MITDSTTAKVMIQKITETDFRENKLMTFALTNELGEYYHDYIMELCEFLSIRCFCLMEDTHTIFVILQVHICIAIQAKLYKIK